MTTYLRFVIPINADVDSTYNIKQSSMFSLINNQVKAYHMGRDKAPMTHKHSFYTQDFSIDLLRFSNAESWNLFSEEKVMVFKW